MLRLHMEAWCSIPHAKRNGCLTDTSSRRPMNIRVPGCSDEPEPRVEPVVRQS
jgi:hypothetical protein